MRDSGLVISLTRERERECVCVCVSSKNDGTVLIRLPCSARDAAKSSEKASSVHKRLADSYIGVAAYVALLPLSRNDPISGLAICLFVIVISNTMIHIIMHCQLDFESCIAVRKCVLTIGNKYYVTGMGNFDTMRIELRKCYELSLLDNY